MSIKENIINNNINKDYEITNRNISYLFYYNSQISSKKISFRAYFLFLKF